MMHMLLLQRDEEYYVSDLHSEFMLRLTSHARHLNVCMSMSMRGLSLKRFVFLDEYGLGFHMTCKPIEPCTFEIR